MPQDTYLFDLNSKRALLSDETQLIVARVSTGKDGTPRRQGIAFIRHGRSSLLRDLERRGIEPTPEAVALINETVPAASDLYERGLQTCFKELIARHSDPSAPA